MKNISFEFMGRSYEGKIETFKIGNQPDALTISASFPDAYINVFVDYNLKDKNAHVLPGTTTPMPGRFPDFLFKVIGKA